MMEEELGAISQKAKGYRRLQAMSHPCPVLNKQMPWTLKLHPGLRVLCQALCQSQGLPITSFPYCHCQEVLSRAELTLVSSPGATEAKYILLVIGLSCLR